MEIVLIQERERESARKFLLEEISNLENCNRNTLFLNNANRNFAIFNGRETEIERERKREVQAPTGASRTIAAARDNVFFRANRR